MNAVAHSFPKAAHQNTPPTAESGTAAKEHIQKIKLEIQVLTAKFSKIIDKLDAALASNSAGQESIVKTYERIKLTFNALDDEVTR